MYERLEFCPSCNSIDFSNSLICKDHLVTGESFAISACNNCELLFTNPRPTNDQLPQFYESDKYISHSNKSNGLIGFLYKLVRSYAIKTKLDLLETYLKPGSLLDFGCGTGEFLKYAKLKNWEVSGVEPDADARNIATKLSNASIYPDVSNIEEKKFDAITLWHSLEHVYHLDKTLRLLSGSISSNGKFFVAVPNYKSLDANIYQEIWAGYDVPRHLYHFSKKAMTKLMANYGLKVNQIYPMKFDSYYISILSEKYRGKRNLLKSFINGWKSNSWAEKNDSNYSSLIYVASK